MSDARSDNGKKPQTPMDLPKGPLLAVVKRAGVEFPAKTISPPSRPR